jgi:hypothetical protein
MSDFLKTDFELTLPQLIFQDQNSDWVLSVEDNSNNLYGDVSLLNALEYHTASQLILQRETQAVQHLQFAPSSTIVDIKTFNGCENDPGYSRLKVSLSSTFPLSLLFVTDMKVRC